MSFIEAVRSMNGTQNASAQPSFPGAGQGSPLGFENSVIAAECAKVRTAGVGNRNRTLNDAAFNLAQVMDPAMWENDLTQAALVSGLPLSEIRQTIQSGVKGAAAKPRPAHRMPTGRPSGPVQDLPEIGEYQETGPPVIDWDELWANPGTIEWLCEPILPAGRLVTIYSPPGVGKSLLAQDLAVAISNGDEALGAPTNQVPVLYLDYENVDLDIRDRLQMMGHDPSRLRNLHYWSFPTMPALDTLEGGQALLRAARFFNAGLVIIDTLSRCVQGEENEASTMLNLYRCTLMPLKAEGIAVLRLDHTGKDENRGPRGTSAKMGDVDLVWRLSEVVPETTFVLNNEKHRIRISEKLLNVRRDQGTLLHYVDTRTVGETKAEAILQACDEAGLPRSAGRDQVRKVMDANGLRGSNQFVADLVRRRQGLGLSE